MEKFINKTYKKFIKLDKMDKLVGATDPSYILKACNDMLRNSNFNTAEKLFKSYYQVIIIRINLFKYSYSNQVL